MAPDVKWNVANIQLKHLLTGPPRPGSTPLSTTTSVGSPKRGSDYWTSPFLPSQANLQKKRSIKQL